MKQLLFLLAIVVLSVACDRKHNPVPLTAFQQDSIKISGSYLGDMKLHKLSYHGGVFTSHDTVYQSRTFQLVLLNANSLKLVLGYSFPVLSSVYTLDRRDILDGQLPGATSYFRSDTAEYSQRFFLYHFSTGDSINLTTEPQIQFLDNNNYYYSYHGKKQ